MEDYILLYGAMISLFFLFFFFLLKLVRLLFFLVGLAWNKKLIVAWSQSKIDKCQQPSDSHFQNTSVVEEKLEIR